MRNLLNIAIAAAVLGGAWWVYDHYDPDHLARFEFVPRAPSSGNSLSNAVFSLAGGNSNSGEIRIGVVDGRGFAPNAPAAANVYLRQLAASWDLICVTNVRTERDDYARELVAKFKSQGVELDYFLGPRVGRGSDYQQYLFLFRPDRIETDRAANYTLDDVEDAVAYDPLMAYFRVRGPQSDRSLTFAVVLWQAAKDAGEQELAMIAPIVRAARHEAFGEDDVFLAASIPAKESELRSYYEPLGMRNAASLNWVLQDANAAGMYLLFDPMATPEYSGTSSYDEIPRNINISVDQAMEQFGALPVWCGFREVEGEQPGYVPIRNKDAHHL